MADDLGQQLALQTQINSLMADRTQMLQRQTSAMSRQAKLMRQLQKTMARADFTEMAGAGQSLAAGLQGSVGPADALTDSLGDAADEAERAGKGGGGFFSKIMGNAGPVLGALGGVASVFQKIGGFLTGAISGIGSLIGGIFELGQSIITLPIKMFLGFVNMAGSMGGGGPSPIRLALEEIRHHFGSLASNEGRAVASTLDTLRSRFRDVSRAGISLKQIYGRGRQGVADALKDLNALAIATGPSFSALSDQFNKNAEVLLRLRRAMGITEEEFGALASYYGARGMDIKKSLLSLADDAIDMGQKFNVSSKLIMRDVGQMRSDFSNFGHLSKQQLLATATYARKLGVEVKQLGGMVDKWLNFEDAAESAAMLQQAFGANVNLMKMMNAQNPAEQIEELRRAMFKAGRTIDDMTLAERKLLEQTTGLQGASLENAFAASKSAVSYKQMESASEQAAKTQRSQVRVLKLLADTLKKTFQGGGAKASKGFFDSFLQGLNRGIQRSGPFRGALIDIKQSLAATKALGQSTGRMFVEMFPGVRQIFEGISQAFDPARFRGMTQQLRTVIKQFFNSLNNPSGDTRKSMREFLSGVWKTLTSWLGGGAEGGAKMSEGIQKFGRTMWKVFSAGMDIAIRGLMDGVSKALETITMLLAKPDKTGEWGNAIGGNMKRAASKGMSKFVMFFHNIWKDHGPRLRAAWGGFVDELNKPPDGMIFRLKRWWENTGAQMMKDIGWTAGKYLLGGIVAYVAGSALLGKIGQMLVKGIGGAANSASSGLGAKLFPTFTSMGDALSKKMGGGFSTGLKWLNSGSKFLGIPAAGWAAGAYVIGKGVMNAINYVEKTGEVGGKAREFGATILESLSFGLLNKEQIKSWGDTLSDYIVGSFTETANQQFQRTAGASAAISKNMQGVDRAINRAVTNTTQAWKKHYSAIEELKRTGADPGLRGQLMREVDSYWKVYKTKEQAVLAIQTDLRKNYNRLTAEQRAAKMRTLQDHLQGLETLTNRIKGDYAKYDKSAQEKISVAASAKAQRDSRASAIKVASETAAANTKHTVAITNAAIKRSKAKQLSEARAILSTTDIELLARGDAAVTAARTIVRGQRLIKQAVRMAGTTISSAAGLGTTIDKNLPVLARAANKMETDVEYQVTKIVASINKIGEQLGSAVNQHINVRIRNLGRAIAVGSKTVRVKKGDFKFNTNIHIKLGRRDLLKAVAQTPADVTGKTRLTDESTIEI